MFCIYRTIGKTMFKIFLIVGMNLYLVMVIQTTVKVLEMLVNDKSITTANQTL